MNLKKEIIIVLLAMFLLTGTASAWYDGYDYRQLVNVSHVNTSGTTLTHFPSYVNVSFETDKMQSNYDDVIFTDTDDNLLPFELESYNTIYADYWINTTILATGLGMYMYYGNDTASSLSNLEGVWDSNYIMVQHLNESPSNDTAGHLDSNSYDNDGTPKNFNDTSNSTTDATGYIDGADRFDGVDDYVDCGNDSSLNITDEITVEAWVKQNAHENNNFVYKTNAYILKNYGPDYDVDYVLKLYINGSYRNAQTTTIETDIGNWTHIVGTYDSVTRTIRLYKDAQVIDTTVLSGLSSYLINTNTNVLSISRGVEAFNGTIDEVRISSTSRTTDWINQTYQLMSNQSTFVTFGVEETYQCYLGDDIAAKWSFNEGSGTTVNDSSCNSNHGTLNYMDTENCWVDGKIGKALEFDGIDDYVDCGNDSSLNITDAITVEAWIKASSFPSSQYPVSKYQTTGNKRCWAIRYANDVVQFRTSPDGTTSYNTLSHTTTIDTNWHHVAGTYDGTTMRIYLDGIEGDNTLECSNLFGSVSTPVNIGRYITGSYFNGTIDEVKIYSRALSAEEVYQCYLGRYFMFDREFFSLLNLDFPGMEEVKSAVEAEDFELAKTKYFDFRKYSSETIWWVDPNDIPTEPVSESNAAADKIVEHIIMEYFVGEDINWEYNPYDPSEPEYTKEWTWTLNRMYFWNTLGEAYWETLDEKYAIEWVAQLIDWVEDNPEIIRSSPSAIETYLSRTLTWRSLEVGDRTGGHPRSSSWINAYNYFLFSSSFTSTDHTTFCKSLLHHAIRLKYVSEDYPDRHNNWVASENTGLGTIGILFPEFKEAATWRNTAINRLDSELTETVYPDGAEIELTTSYHQRARVGYAGIFKLATTNEVSLPTNYSDNLRMMYIFNLYMMMPTGSLPPLNDAWTGSITSSSITENLEEAYQFWGDEEFLFGATLGAQGTKPEYDSYFFNYAGYYIMKSGWKYLDRYLLFDAGPLGSAYVHQDKLNIYISAFGKVLLTEPGNYAYDHSIWREYVLSTRAHNTILVDGKEQRRAAGVITDPLDNPNITSPYFDYVSGNYSSGYQERIYDQETVYKYIGEKDMNISHTREVIFIKPYYWLVYDFLEGEGNHTYDAYFHLDAPDAEIGIETKAVYTLNSNIQLGLYPISTNGLEVEIIIGQTDPVVLGWIPIEDRAIPTVVYSKEGVAPQDFSTFLYPYYEERPTIEYLNISLPDDMHGKDIFTPKEEVCIILDRRENSSLTEVSSSLKQDNFYVNSNLTLLRKLLEDESLYFCFYEVYKYNDSDITIEFDSPVNVLMSKIEQERYIFYNIEEENLESNMTFSFMGTIYYLNSLGERISTVGTVTGDQEEVIALPSETWVEVTSREEVLSASSLVPFVDNYGPDITNIKVKNIETDSATITWTTDQSTSNNRIKYGKKSDLSNSAWSNWHNNTDTVEIKLSNLKRHTTYYYQVWSYNSIDSSFNTSYPTSQPFSSFETVGVMKPSDFANNIVTPIYSLFVILMIAAISGIIIAIFSKIDVDIYVIVGVATAIVSCSIILYIGLFIMDSVPT